MSELIVWLLAAFGAAYIVGHSRISKSSRQWLAEHSLYLTEMLECPACFGTWLGLVVGAFKPVTLTAGFVAQRALDNVEPEARVLGAIVVACMTAGSNYLLARLTNLVRPEALDYPEEVDAAGAAAGAAAVAAFSAEPYADYSDMEPEDPQNAAALDALHSNTPPLHDDGKIHFKLRSKFSAILHHVDASSLARMREIYPRSQWELVEAEAYGELVIITDADGPDESLAFEPKPFYETSKRAKESSP